MKILRNTVIVIVAIMLLSSFGLWVTGNAFILTAISRTYLVGNSTANIDDYKQFKSNTIANNKVQEWLLADNYATDKLPQDFRDELEKNDAVAFLVVKDGKLVTESYFDGYDEWSKTNSFSMAKTVVTLLTGIAIDEGYIESIRQPLIDFLPEFKDDSLAQRASLGSLSTMSSGYDWDESYYNPFSPTVKLYYGSDVVDFLTRGSFAHEPDTYHYYSSASTQLLAIALRRALRTENPDITLSDYLSEKLWQPLGMNDDALWHIDNSGMELGYCCINTNARNFAKLGQLMLQDGVWNGDTLVSPEYVKMMYEPVFVDYYGYSTWIGVDAPEPFYYFRGHLGQFVIVVPDQNLAVVRLGKTVGQGKVEDNLKYYISAAIKLVES